MHREKLFTFLSVLVVIALLGFYTWTVNFKNKSTPDEAAPGDSITYIGVIYDGSKEAEKDRASLNRILRLIERDKEIKKAVRENDSLKKVIDQVKNKNREKNAEIKNLERDISRFDSLATDSMPNVLVPNVPDYIKDTLRDLLSSNNSLYEINEINTVTLKFYINKKGKAVKVTASGGSAELQRAAIKAVKYVDFSSEQGLPFKMKLKIRFSPKTKN